MTEIQSYFSNINSEIRNARTRKALIFLERHARNYVTQFSGPMIRKDVQRQAKSELKRSLKLIRERKKEVTA